MAQASAQPATKKVEFSRDPRMDPQQGDIVIASLKGTSREVLERDGRWIVYESCRLGGTPETRGCTLSTWKAWCSTNKVLL